LKSDNYEIANIAIQPAEEANFSEYVSDSKLRSTNLLQKIAHSSANALVEYNCIQKQREEGKRQINQIKMKVARGVMAEKFHKKVISWQNNDIQYELSGNNNTDCNFCEQEHLLSVSQFLIW
jgi:hypothetical protein